MFYFVFFYPFFLNAVYMTFDSIDLSDEDFASAEIEYAPRWWDCSILPQLLIIQKCTYLKHNFVPSYIYSVILYKGDILL
jgi:hypothetical protein